MHEDAVFKLRSSTHEPPAAHRCAQNACAVEGLVLLDQVVLVALIS